jgi:hypothetical protein
VAVVSDGAVLTGILDLARWAPSGDNTQPWRFEIIDAQHIAVHGFDTREHVLYDFDGHASQMAHGALLETIRIAATGSGLAASWTLRAGTPETAPVYDVKFEPRAANAPDPLIESIKRRTSRPAEALTASDSGWSPAVESWVSNYRCFGVNRPGSAYATRSARGSSGSAR